MVRKKDTQRTINNSINNEIEGIEIRYKEVLERHKTLKYEYQNIIYNALRYNYLESFFESLQSHDKIKSILYENGIYDLFDIHNYVLKKDSKRQKVFTSLKNLIEILQRMEPKVPNYVKLFEQNIKAAYNFWKHYGQSVILLENIKLLSHPEDILGTYKDRTNLLKKLGVDSVSSIDKEKFAQNIVIGEYRALYQEIIQKKFIFRLKDLLAIGNIDELKTLTKRLYIIKNLVNILNTGAIYCGITFHDINPGDLINSDFHNEMVNSKYFNEQYDIKKALLKFEHIWDAKRIMWIDTIGFTNLNTNKKNEFLTKSKVLVYKKEYLS